MSPTKTRTTSAKAAPSKAAAGKAGRTAAGKVPPGKDAAGRAAKTASAKAAAGKAATSGKPAKRVAAIASAPSGNGRVPHATHPRTAAPAGAPAPADLPGPYAGDGKFMAEQQALLLSERVVYESQASDLKAEADSLAQEREPGDVQFDEESGEGGTVTVDRERDLALSAQATAAVEEIDAALARITDHSYGGCERCHQAIPKPRLKALPYARLCVACKSGGLSRR